MARDSQLQVSDFPDSLSVISEPPDVRNWFSSYVYESPVLGSEEDFGDPLLNESEISNLRRVFGNGRREAVGVPHKFDESENVDKLDGDEKRASDFGSCYGASGRNGNGEESLTEAPDSLQSNLPASDSDAIEEKSSVGTRPGGELPSNHVKTDGLPENHNLDKDKQCREFAGYSSSSSLLSEPPHISNWFSSYVYESPELDSLEDFGCSDAKDDLLIREIINSKAETPSELNQKKTNAVACTTPDLIPPTIQSPREVNHEMKVNKNLPFDAVAGVVVTKVKSECIAVAPDSNRQAKKEMISSKGCGSRLSPEKEISRYAAKSRYKRDHINFDDTVSHVSGRDNQILCPGDQASGRTRDDIISRNGKENLEPCSSNSGFVSIRKKAAPALCLGPGSKPQEAVVNQCLNVKRTPLAETTNLPRRQEDAVEYAGKWKCPQKSKPLVGPPMKQLRLERWVYKV
ncbi:hypothetical protein MLD38_010661 [Melastoma candidum]|uniref:Uncharacterized protein n=1 Tax=Melastoma candidum TaxID=119954 RepID=A0ACB9R1M8_9MYRT|nr:hypothetical protein MLD38_010661 [Melastoma candidum]